MRTAPNNPSTNTLGPAVTESDLSAAISQSGYPLQTVIADLLSAQFSVQQEWTYVDMDTKTTRAIDVLAERDLYDSNIRNPRVRPALDLMVECKQSDLPYVFFLCSSRPWVRYFPLLAGLFGDTVVITTDDDPSEYVHDILRALGLDSHPFVAKGPEYCMSFGKCHRDGSNLKLSGEESFHGIVLPILKAMRHFQMVESPPKTALYFDCHLIVGIGVLGAPMVGVRVSGQSHSLNLVPWVRVVRHETDEILDWHGTRRGYYAIDLVHRDYLQDYLEKELLPFSLEFSRLVIKHQTVLASGKAFAKGMRKDSWRNIEQRLQPRR
jgi:hypothetical protein